MERLVRVIKPESIAGTVLLQVDDPESYYGFYLADPNDETGQTFDGGIGIASEWELDNGDREGVLV